jgi:hypothetical protein
MNLLIPPFPNVNENSSSLILPTIHLTTILLKCFCEFGAISSVNYALNCRIMRGCLSEVRRAEAMAAVVDVLVDG